MFEKSKTFSTSQYTFHMDYPAGSLVIADYKKFDICIIDPFNCPAKFIFDHEQADLMKNPNVSLPDKEALLDINSNNPPEDKLQFDKLLDEINLELASNKLLRVKNDAKEISFIKLGLTRVPEILIEKLRKFPRLQSLKLSFNNLKKLPESLFTLTQLTELDLSQNKLTMLPEAIGNLNKLQELKLQNNNLETLPFSLKKLVSLKFLSLRENVFLYIPKCIKQTLIRTGNSREAAIADELKSDYAAYGEGALIGSFKTKIPLAVTKHIFTFFSLSLKDAVNLAATTKAAYATANTEDEIYIRKINAPKI